MNTRMEAASKLLRATGITEEPFGIHYSDEKPANAFGPKEGPVISRELEEQNRINWLKVLLSFSCVMGNLWLARNKKKAAFISQKHYGCPGGGIYTGFYPNYFNLVPGLVSTGVPGTPISGERYMKSPEAMRTFMDLVAPLPAPKSYCVLRPLSHFTQDSPPEFVTFFARAESISGLSTLIHFATGDLEAIATPFGAGCSHLVGWPRYYQSKGQERAVLGTFDPSARKFMKPDELFLTVPLSLLDKMLVAMPRSHLRKRSWDVIMKKVAKSNRTWSEA